MVNQSLLDPLLPLTSNNSNNLAQVSGQLASQRILLGYRTRHGALLLRSG